MKLSHEVAIVAAATAFGGVPASAEAFDWQHVGGNPFGSPVHSVAQAKHDLLSPNGQQALRAEGLGSADINALDQAARAGEMHGCNIPAGVNFPKMVSGGFEVTSNNVLDDPRFPNGIGGFCLKATRTYDRNGFKFTRVIKEAEAGPCDNFLEQGISVSEQKIHKPVHHPKHHPKKPTRPLWVGKDAVGSNGVELPVFPTGEFDGTATCKDGNSTVTTNFVLMHNPQEVIAACNVGSTATVTEDRPIVNPEDWTMLTPAMQRIIIHSKGQNIVGMKDKEVTGTPPPPPPKKSAAEATANVVCAPNSGAEVTVVDTGETVENINVNGQTSALNSGSSEEVFVSGQSGSNLNVLVYANGQVILNTTENINCTPPPPQNTPPAISIVNKNQEPIDAGSPDVICETVSGGNPGDKLVVTATAINESTNTADGTITSPTFNSGLDQYCETWTNDGTPTTDVRITTEVVDTTEQAAGDQNNSATDYTDIAVRQPS